MADLSIDLVTPAGMVLEATILPDDMMTQEVVAELVDELSLPRRFLRYGSPAAATRGRCPGHGSFFAPAAPGFVLTARARGRTVRQDDPGRFRPLTTVKLQGRVGWLKRR